MLRSDTRLERRNCKTRIELGNLELAVPFYLALSLDSVDEDNELERTQGELP